METPRFIAPEKNHEMKDFFSSNLRELSLSPEQSEGFMYLPPENITIIPAKGTGGVIEITEPEQLVGIDTFSDRNRFEKEYPQKGLEESVAYDNAVLSGALAPEQYHPELGARFCLAVANLYQTKDDLLLSMPILPPGGHKYSQHSKLQATNMARGKASFPKRDYLLKGAIKKESHSLQALKKRYPHERIIGNPEILPTGLWTIRFKGKKGGYSELRNCHVQRDIETGTLDAFLIQKQFVFDEFSNFQTQEHIHVSAERVYILASMKDLKSTHPDQPVPIQKMFYANQEVRKFSDLPFNWQPMFREKDGKIYYSSFKAVPPLRAFLQLESKVLEQKSERMVGEIRDMVGRLLEKKVADVLQQSHQPNFDHLEIPPNDILIDLMTDMPDDFKAWAGSLHEKVVTVNPDFILEDGTFIEVKVGQRPEGDTDAKKQLYRTILYFLIQRHHQSQMGPPEKKKVFYVMLRGKNETVQPCPGIEIEFVNVQGIPETQDWQTTMRQAAEGKSEEKPAGSSEKISRENLKQILRRELTEDNLKTIHSWLKEIE